MSSFVRQLNPILKLHTFASDLILSITSQTSCLHGHRPQPLLVKTRSNLGQNRNALDCHGGERNAQTWPKQKMPRGIQSHNHIHTQISDMAHGGSLRTHAEQLTLRQSSSVVGHQSAQVGNTGASCARRVHAESMLSPPAQLHVLRQVAGTAPVIHCVFCSARYDWCILQSAATIASSMTSASLKRPADSIRMLKNHPREAHEMKLRIGAVTNCQLVRQGALRGSATQRQ